MKSDFLGEIITTGSELMLGQMTDTNSAWLSATLGQAGLRTVRHTSVGDDQPRLVRAFQRAWADDHQVTVVTGGLGPTEDDLTRPAVAEAFGRELEFHEPLAENLRDMFRRRGYPLTDNNLRQAWLPRGSLMVPNPLGTAPGFALAEDQRLMVFLPGVPQEMKRMVTDWLLPRFKEQFPWAGSHRKTVVLKTGGLGESAVDQLVADLMAPGLNPSVGLLASPDQVRVVVTAEGRTEAELDSLMSPTLTELEKRLAGYVFAHGPDISLAQAVAEQLRLRGLRLIILDAITQGRLSGVLSPSLDEVNWGGAQDLPWQPTVSGVLEILRLYAPDSLAHKDDPDLRGLRRHREIRLIVTARPDPEAPPPRPGETALAIECAVQREAMNHGRPLVQHFNLGGAAGRALARAASLSVFHLWKVLSEWPAD